MISLFSGLYEILTTGNSASVEVLFVGIDRAGKTTLVNALGSTNEEMQLENKPQDSTSYQPTIGLNTSELRVEHVTLKMLDLGGRENVRKIWTHYYDAADKVVFVVDSNDEDRIDEIKPIFERTNRGLGHKRFAVVLNKIDLGNPTIIESEFELLCAHSNVPIFLCSAVTGVGLQRLMQWMVQV